jgi:hypothetical protein
MAATEEAVVVAADLDGAVGTFEVVVAAPDTLDMSVKEATLAAEVKFSEEGAVVVPTEEPVEEEEEEEEAAAAAMKTAVAEAVEVA